MPEPTTLTEPPSHSVVRSLRAAAKALTRQIAAQHRAWCPKDTDIRYVVQQHGGRVTVKLEPPAEEATP